MGTFTRSAGVALLLSACAAEEPVVNRCPAAIDAGGAHTCASAVDGSLWCWGDNTYGQLMVKGDSCGGRRGSLCKPSPVELQAFGHLVANVSAGSISTCVRRTDGLLWCWGAFMGAASGAPIVALGTDVAEVSVGGDFACALKVDGSLWCWGGNDWGQLGDGTTDARSSPVRVTALGAEVAEVAATTFSACARKTDGTLWCWGRSVWGADIGCGARDDAGVYMDQCTHAPRQFEPLEAEIVDVVTSAYDSCALKADGSLRCWTAYDRTPRAITALGTDVVEAAVGYHFTCALKTDGSVWCWGFDAYGMLGDGSASLDDIPEPIEITSLGRDVAELTAGDLHTCARKRDGSVWCWGWNSYGQVGDGTLDDKPSPVHVPLSCP